MPKVHKLKNNITLILDPNKDSLLTSVFVGVPVGSNNENANQHGLAHFFEHMCFKGTKEYPEPSTLCTKVESLGLSPNAFTSTETTAYHLTGNAKHLEEMIHISSEMFINSLFPAEELEKEKGVIVEEIKMYEDNPGAKSREVAELELFKGTEAGHLILGSIESVRSFSRDDFLKFYHKHYVADNTIIAISGKFNDEAILKKVREEFENMSRGEETKHPILEINKTLGNQFTSIARKGIEQTSVAISFYSVGEDSKKTEIAELLSVVLGATRISRLYTSIREEMGACYRICSVNGSFANYGEFSIQTGISPNNFDRVINQIAVECGRLKTELITAEELERAKQILIGKILLDTEATINRAAYHFLQYVSTGEVITIEERINRINKVTIPEIQDMAREIFKGDEVKIASVGNTKFEDSSIAPLLNI